MTAYGKDMLITPTIAAGLGYVGSKMVLGNTGNVTLVGYSLDKNLANAGVIGVGSVVSGLTKNAIIPKIPIMSSYPYVTTILQKSVGPAICGLSTYGLNAALVNEGNSYLYGSANTSTPLNNFLLGAGSQVGADYIAGMWGY